MLNGLNNEKIHENPEMKMIIEVLIIFIGPPTAKAIEHTHKVFHPVSMLRRPAIAIMKLPEVRIVRRMVNGVHIMR